jgi:hypothetical protein
VLYGLCAALPRKVARHLIRWKLAPQSIPPMLSRSMQRLRGAVRPA